MCLDFDCSFTNNFALSIVSHQNKTIINWFICGKPISIVRHVKSTTRIKNPFIFRPLFSVGSYKTIPIRFSFNNTSFGKFFWLFTISLIFSILLIFQFITFRDLVSLFLAITTIFGVLASRF